MQVKPYGGEDFSENISFIKSNETEQSWTRSFARIGINETDAFCPAVFLHCTNLWSSKQRKRTAMPLIRCYWPNYICEWRNQEHARGILESFATFVAVRTAVNVNALWKVKTTNENCDKAEVHSESNDGNQQWWGQSNCFSYQNRAKLMSHSKC